MIAGIVFLVFASAFAASVGVLWSSLAPAMPRIVALLRDSVDPKAQQPAYIVSEPRLRARVGAMQPMVRPSWRAAA